MKKDTVMKKDLTEIRQRLKELLLQKSYREGKDKLSSGLESDFYLDAEGSYLCGKLLYEMIRTEGKAIGGVGGMTLGADPLVTATSLVSYLAADPIPAFIVRKEPKGHGTGNYIEGKSNLPAGDRVEAQGYEVGLVATVVDRQEGEKEALAKKGYKLISVFTREELLA